MSIYYSTTYDSQGIYVDTQAYPTEISDMYIEEADFIEILAYETMADEIYHGARSRDY